MYARASPSAPLAHEPPRTRTHAPAADPQAACLDIEGTTAQHVVLWGAAQTHPCSTRECASSESGPLVGAPAQAPDAAVKANRARCLHYILSVLPTFLQPLCSMDRGCVQGRLHVNVCLRFGLKLLSGTKSQLPAVTCTPSLLHQKACGPWYCIYVNGFITCLVLKCLDRNLNLLSSKTKVWANSSVPVPCQPLSPTCRCCCCWSKAFLT